MTIIIRPRHIERFFSIVIILVLVILLVLSYLNDSCLTSDNQDSALNNDDSQDNQPINNTLITDDTVNSNSSTSSDDSSDIVVETCDDKIKNQDETNIDCGGACTSSNGAYYYDDDCHTTEKKTINTALKIRSVGYAGGDTTSAKMESITVDISNGEGKNELFTLEVYVLDRYGNSYLNQLDGSYRGDPFASMTLVVANEQVITNRELPLQNVNSPYLLQNDNYGAGEPFMIEVVLKNRAKEVVKEVRSSVINP